MSKQNKVIKNVEFLYDSLGVSQTIRNEIEENRVQLEKSYILGESYEQLLAKSLAFDKSIEHIYEMKHAIA